MVDDAVKDRRDCQMRSLSLVLALVFLLAGATLADTSDGALPGIGTFAYGGSRTLAAAPSVIIAVR
jgi:hypothetical protein